MKLLYFIEAFSGINFIDGHTYMAADGVLFDENKINLDFYLKGSHEISFLGKDFISVYYLMNEKEKREVFSLKNGEKYESSVLQYGENDCIIDISDSICALQKYSEANGYENVYISLLTGDRVIPKDFDVVQYIDHEYLIMISSDILYCVNWNNNFLWRHEFGKKQFHYKPNHIFENVSGAILINWGELNDGTGLISLIERGSGNAIWERKFPVRIEDSRFINNKIYLCIGNKMMVMNTQGETEREFIADIPDQQLLSFWTDEKLLYVFATISNQILAYTLDGQFIKRYQLPEHPVLWHGSKIYRVGDVNYLCLYRSEDYFVGVESGLLTWTPENILAGRELELEERPLIVIMTIKEDDGTQSYYLNIPCIDIHELLRHTEIEVRRLLSMRSKPYYFENKETRNKKFNGQVKLLIEPAIGEENRPYLDMLVKRCNYFASSSFLKSGNGKKDIEVSWEFSDQL